MKKLIYVSGLLAVALGLAACANENMNGNANANANANMARSEATPAITPTPANARGQYTEEQARAERARRVLSAMPGPGAIPGRRPAAAL